MASRTLTLIFLINFIIATYCQDPNTSSEITERHPKTFHENVDIPEDTTLHSEEVEEEYRTTTVPAEDYRRRIDLEDARRNRDEFKRRELEESFARDEDEFNPENVRLEEDDNMENATEEVGSDVTASSVNNDVDSSLNLTNNIDTVITTETLPVQTTTRPVEEEPVPMVQDSKEELDTQGPRIPKADNDPEHIFPPQSTRSIVRGWLEDSWLRAPIGILVPLRASALNRALAVWTDLNESALNLSRVCFMAYDENGVSWRSKHNLHPTSYGSHEKTVTEALSKLLLKYQGVNTDSRSDGTMKALIGASKLVPYDSALFVLTDEGAGDAQRMPLALRAVVEKRLKVYTLWTDSDYPTIENDEGLQALQNISRHTEGEVIPYPLQVIDVESSSNLASGAELEQWKHLDKQGRRGKLNPEVQVEKFDLLVVRRKAGQVIALGVPVENGVSALRIFIEGAVEHAVLYPPNEAPQIDLYNATSVASFSASSRSDGSSPRDVYLVFPGNTFDLNTLSVLPASVPRPDAQSAFVGTWHLSVRCDNCDYRLCLSARSLIHFEVATDTPNSMKIRVTGPVASVRESQLVDEYGTELAKLPFRYQPTTGDGQTIEIDSIVELVAEVAIPAVQSPKVYAKIVGRDTRGEPFVRLAGPLIQPEVRLGRSASIVFPDSLNDLERAEEMNSKAYSSQLLYNDSAMPYNRASQVVNQQGTLLTSVQIGLATRLYGSPGDNLQLHFEVTNYREQTVRCQFGAVGELRFLTGITPTAQNIGSGQTVNVIVSLTIPSTAQPGARDMITFTAYGNEQISLSAYVYVNSLTNTGDVWAPEVRHTFQGTCLGRTGDDCAQHAWSATIVARDALSGLLRLSSSPIGLLYNGDFISGTREDVIATYRATCCAPRMLLNAVDANGNANSYIIDISGYLNEAAIAAIVLGVFLIIALIVLLILLTYWCVKKRRESRELPSYNTRS